MPMLVFPLRKKQPECYFCLPEKGKQTDGLISGIVISTERK